MMEAVRICETSVHFNVNTRRYIPEDSKFHTRRRENLKSHIVNLYGEATLRCFRRFESLWKISDYGGSTHLRNVGPLQRDYTALHPRRLNTSRRENQKSRMILFLFEGDRYSGLWG
jgi:hypothetical protein